MKLTRLLPGLALTLTVGMVSGCPTPAPSPSTSAAPSTAPSATTTTDTTPTATPGPTATPYVNPSVAPFGGFPSNATFTGRLTYDGGNLPFAAAALYREASLTGTTFKSGPTGLELARAYATGHFYFTTKHASPSLQVRYAGTGELEHADVNFLNDFVTDIKDWASHSTEPMTPDVTYEIKWDSTQIVPAPKLLDGNVYDPNVGVVVPRFKGLDGDYEIRLSKGRPSSTNRVATATFSAGVDPIVWKWDGKGCTTSACAPSSSGSAVVTGTSYASKIWLQAFVTKAGGKQGERNYASSKYLIFKTTGAATAPTDATILAGKTLYDAKCWVCHIDDKSNKTRTQLDTAITAITAMEKLSTLTSTERDQIVKYSAWLYQPVNP